MRYWNVLQSGNMRELPLLLSSSLLSCAHFACFNWCTVFCAPGSLQQAASLLPYPAVPYGPIYCIVASLSSCTIWTQSLLLSYSAVPYGPSHCCLPIQLYQMYSAASCFPIQMYRKDPAIASLSSNHGLVYTVHRSSPASPVKTLSVPAHLLGLTKSLIASLSSCTIWTQLYYMDRSIVVSL